MIDRLTTYATGASAQGFNVDFSGRAEIAVGGQTLAASPAPTVTPIDPATGAATTYAGLTLGTPAVSGSLVTFSAAGLVAGTLYTFRVVGWNSGGTGMPEIIELWVPF